MSRIAIPHVWIPWLVPTVNILCTSGEWRWWSSPTCIFRTTMYTRNYNLSRAVGACTSQLLLCNCPLEAPRCTMDALLKRFVSVRNVFAAYFLYPFTKVVLFKLIVSFHCPVVTCFLNWLSVDDVPISDL